MTDPPLPDLDALRTALAARVEEVGNLRAVAHEAGMSPVTLRNLLAGQSVYAKTLRRLLEWWTRRNAPSFPRLSSPAVAEVLDDLFGSFPAEVRPAARERFLDTLRALHATHPEHCPGWVGELVNPDPSPAPPAGRGNMEDRR